MEGVTDGKGEGACEAEAEVRDGRVARDARVGREGATEAEAACEAEGAMADASEEKGEPTSFELGSKPSKRAPKRQTNLFVK